MNTNNNNNKDRTKLTVRILCAVLAGLMVAGAATYLIYGLFGLL